MVQLLIYSLAQLMAAAYSCPLVQKTWQQGAEREQLTAVRSRKERRPKDTEAPSPNHRALGHNVQMIINNKW